MEENKENTKEEQKSENSRQEAEVKETKTVPLQEVSIKKELEETTDRLKRIMAEFDNYKKRSSKERENLYGMILSDVIGKILPVVDNLEKATGVDTKDEEYKQGIGLLLKQFMDVLASLGVSKIETVGTKFDPELHDAVSLVQDEGYGEKIVSAELRSGYIIGNKVIRHAMVVVAN